jgi:hypothetical protein
MTNSAINPSDGFRIAAQRAVALITASSAALAMASAAEENITVMMLDILFMACFGNDFLTIDADHDPGARSCSRKASHEFIARTATWAAVPGGSVTRITYCLRSRWSATRSSVVTIVHRRLWCCRWWGHPAIAVVRASALRFSAVPIVTAVTATVTTTHHQGADK